MNSGPADFNNIKMKGYNFNSQSNKPISASKRDIEDRKKREDEVAAAVAFEEYMNTFQDSGMKSSNKVWIKAGTYDAGKRQFKEENKDKQSRLYKPTSRFTEQKQQDATPFFEDPTRPERLGKKKEKEKKKSNLEIFKEELKIIQEEREERHRLKTMLGLQEVIKLPPKPGDELRSTLSLELDDVKMGSIDDNSDPNTTNIYLGNLPTKISEQFLMEIFGKFGPLASVKIMWPRTEEEKTRNRLSGFVAFMSRRDGERALKNLGISANKVFGPDIKLGWGKSVPIPSYPIYIPPSMLELTMPPPLSGLPFNAQPDKKDRNRIPPPGTPYPTDPRGKEEFERVLYNATVKVVIPTDRILLALIHRMVEFVAREGPMFEAMIMNREIANPQFRFLFENQSPAHIYYRWKLFSILQGDSTQRWRSEEFRMFKGGSVWRPPNMNMFTSGMPDELVPEEEREIRKGSLSNAQRDRLERMLRNISPTRHKVAEVMIFSIEHSESADEICQTIKESLSNPKTAMTRKIARIYVISDILHNCTAKGMNAINYRKAFKNHLPGIFQEIHFAYQTSCAEGIGESSESFKQRVCACFRVWEDWGIYPNEFLIRLQNIFLGLLTANSREEEEKIFEGLDSDNDEDVLKKRRKSPPKAQMPPRSALNLVKSLQSKSNSDTMIIPNAELDGIPLDDLDGFPMSMSSDMKERESLLLEHHQQLQLQGLQQQKPQQMQLQQKKGGFIPSKWETVDPEEVKAQAVTTTSKWDLFEDSSENKEESLTPLASLDKNQIGLVAYDEEDLDGEPMEEEEDDSSKNLYPSSSSYDEENSEHRRVKLREIELKVLAYQDEIESGRKSIRYGSSISEMVQDYREKLLKKAEKSSRSDDDDGYSNSNRSRSGDYNSSRSSKRERERDRSRSGSYEERNRERDRREKDRDRDREKERDRDKSPSSKSSRRRHRDKSKSPSSSSRSSPRHRSHRSRSRSRSKSPQTNRNKRSSRSRSPSLSSRSRSNRKHKR